MTRKNILRAVAAAAAISLVGLAAHAQPEPSETIADRANRIRAQVELLNQEAELQRALARNVSTELTALPRIVAIYGMETNLQARLLLSGGMISTYSEGDAVRSNMRVVAITPKSVLLRVTNGSKSATLPLDFVTSAGAPTPGSPLGMPSPMGGPGMPSGSPLPPELLPSPPAVGAPVRPAAPVVAPAAAATAAPPAQPAAPAPAR